MSFLSQPISIFPSQPQRTIGGGLSGSSDGLSYTPPPAPIQMQVVVDERTTDTLTITKQPVQQGAAITDNSFMEPTVFNSTAYFKDNSQSILSEFASLLSPSSGLEKIYQSLLNLQLLRQPFTVVTPKRTYTSMLLASLSQTTDKNTENCLSVSMSFQQVIIVSVGTTNVPRIRQKNPGATGATQQAGSKQSSLYTGAQIIGIRP